MKRRHFLTTASGAIAATTLTRCGTKDRPTLRICSWADYLSPELTAKFEKDNKCTLQIDTSDSNEAIYAKLTSGNGSYDLAIPSSYMVKKLVRENKLATLDHSKLRNLKHVDQAYLQRALDPAMAHSVPYMMACTCLAWHKSKVEDAVPSYAMLDRTDLKGRITLLDDMREVLGAALRSHGHSINSTDAAQLSQARDTAIRWKRNIARFDNKDYKNGIASGELDLVQGYTGDLLRIAEEDGDIEVRIPREGSAFSCDDLCIPATSTNQKLAHAFINFVTEPANAVANMNFIAYRAPNSSAYQMLSEDFRGNPALFPEAEVFAKCEPIDDLGESLAMWTKTWNEVKTAG